MTLWLRQRLGAVPAPLTALLVLAVLQSLAWIALSPLDQGPDESAHFAYVQYLAETGHKPYATKGATPNSSEQQQYIDLFGLTPLTGNPPARPLWGPVVQREWKALQPTYTAALRRNGDGPNGQAQNPPLYYGYQAIPYRLGLAAGGDVRDRMTLSRLANIPLYLAGVIMVWLLAAELFGAWQWLPTVATGMVVLHPKLSSLVASINTETLLFAAFTGAMLMAARCVRRGPTVARVAALAAFAGAAALTQGRGLAAIPAAGLALLLALLRHRPPRRQALVLVGAAGTVLAVTAAILFVTTAGSGTGPAYGGEVARSAGTTSGAFSLKQFLGQTWQFYLPKLGFMTHRLGPDYGYRQVYIETFYGGLFSYEVNPSKAIFDLLQSLTAAGLIWTAVAAAAKRHRLLRAWHLVVAVGGFFVSELVALHLNSYTSLLTNPDPIITGRYLISSLAMFGVVIAFCVGSLPRRAGVIAGALLLGAGVLMQVGEFGLTISRFYG
jgi:hypothetical protein